MMVARRIDTNYQQRRGHKNPSLYHHTSFIRSHPKNAALPIYVYTIFIHAYTVYKGGIQSFTRRYRVADGVTILPCIYDDDHALYSAQIPNYFFFHSISRATPPPPTLLYIQRSNLPRVHCKCICLLLYLL